MPKMRIVRLGFCLYKLGALFDQIASKTFFNLQAVPKKYSVFLRSTG